MKRPNAVNEQRPGGLTAALLVLALLGLPSCKEEQSQQSSEIGPTVIDVPMLENDPITAENILVHLIQANESDFRLRLTNRSGASVVAYLPVALNFRIVRLVGQDSGDVIHLLTPIHEESTPISIDDVWESVVQSNPIPADERGGLVALKMELMLGVQTDEEAGIVVAEFPVKFQKGEQDGTGQPATRPESQSEGSDKPQPEPEGRSR